MKSKKKFFLISFIIIVFLVILFILSYLYFTDTTKLNASEKKFLADNSTTVQNFNVLNNVSIFGDNGSGVFYDFLEDFYKEYNLKINSVTYNLGESPSNIAFTIGNTYNENEFVFYEGHYVLISKEKDSFSNATHLTNQKIGILNDNLSYVSGFLDNPNLTIKTYNTNEELLKSFEEQSEINYMIIPLCLNMENILKNKYL